MTNEQTMYMTDVEDSLAQDFGGTKLREMTNQLLDEANKVKLAIGRAQDDELAALQAYGKSIETAIDVLKTTWKKLHENQIRY